MLVLRSAYAGIVTLPSMALCDIRPPWMVEVQILQEQISVRQSLDKASAPAIAPYLPPCRHKKTPTEVGVSSSLLGDEPRAIAIP